VNRISWLWAWSQVLSVFELWSSSLRLRLWGRSAAKAKAQTCELISSFQVKLISSSREEFSQKMHFSLNFTIIFSLDLTHLLSSERIHKNWQKITDFFKLTPFKWFALKNVIFIWLIIQIQSSEAQLTVQTWASKYKRRPILKEAQLKDQEFWAALIGARAWSSAQDFEPMLFTTYTYT
jgi:hypothetical protein